MRNQDIENQGMVDLDVKDSDMLNKIRESARNINVPEQLAPESVKARLDESLAAEKNAGNQTSGARDRMRQKTRRVSYRNLAAAACLCICFGAAAISYFYGKDSIKNSVDDQNFQQKQIEIVTSGQGETADDSCKKNSNHAAAENEEKKVKKLGKSYTLASGYEDVYEVLKKSRQDMLAFGTRTESTGALEKEDAVKSAAQDVENTAVSKEFSTTNLQVEGVDESDAVKTDGKYIYVVQEEQVQILDARGKTLKLAATLKPDIKESLDSICEIYVADNVLTLVLQADKTGIQKSESDSSKAKKSSSMVEEDMVYIDYDVVTKVLAYDITDPLHPALLDTAEQDGYYQTSRKIENHLYLFTNKEMYIQDDITKPFNGSRAEEWIPCVNGKAVRADCIYLPKEGNQGVVMTCMDLSAHCDILDTKMLVSQGAQLFVTADSAYFYELDYAGGSEKTKIARFALDSDGNIRATAAVSLKGGITDTFAICENNGYLHVLTSLKDREPWENRVYVIGTVDMKVVGKLTGIAKGEMIYAARFVGKTGYFVTYRNTDPLFTVDFSEPENPKLIGELAVTGFSEYLHFWSDDLLFGIGYETNPAGGEIIGVKLSMYDISNPKKVTELAKMVLPDTDDSEAMYDYKSVLIDRNKNLIAFTTQTYGEQYHDDYHVFSFKNGEFNRKLARSLGINGCGDNLRSLYIGDMLYLVGSRKALSFSMVDNFKETGKITY